MDPPDDQHIVLQLDLADGLGKQLLVRSVDMTRLQRASKGSCKSTGRRRDDVIERRRLSQTISGGFAERQRLKVKLQRLLVT